MDSNDVAAGIIKAVLTIVVALFLGSLIGQYWFIAIPLGIFSVVIMAFVESVREDGFFKTVIGWSLGLGVIWLMGYCAYEYFFMHDQDRATPPFLALWAVGAILTFFEKKPNKV